MARIIDLDAVVGADITVKLGGEKYKLPADIPITDVLELEHLSQQFNPAAGDDVENGDDTSQIQILESLYATALRIFRYRQPDIEALPIGVVQLVAFILNLYGSDGDNDSAVEESGTARPISGTKSTRARKQKT